MGNSLSYLDNLLPKTKANHALNLAVADAIKSVKCISDSLETVREIACEKVDPEKHEVG